MGERFDFLQDADRCCVHCSMEYKHCRCTAVDKLLARVTDAVTGRIDDEIACVFCGGIADKIEQGTPVCTDKAACTERAERRAAHVARRMPWL